MKRARHTPLLKLVEPPSTWAPIAGDPPPRAVCKSGPRPCPYIECRHHLWTLVGDDRAGRPHGDRRPPTVLRPATNESCEADVVDRNPDGLPNKEVGRLLGITGERVRQIVRGAGAKMVELVDDEA